MIAKTVFALLLTALVNLVSFLFVLFLAGLLAVSLWLLEEAVIKKFGKIGYLYMAVASLVWGVAVLLLWDIFL